ncbi:hypothetical protein G9A89_005495 [Geosiphon pyriformis]|nr:hypothetical protein G9A89_005495 [Geosiphon pyriformis]
MQLSLFIFHKPAKSFGIQPFKFVHYQHLFTNMAKSKKSSSNPSHQKSEKSTDTDSKTKSPFSQLSERSIKISLLVKPGAKESRVTDIANEYVGLQIAAPPKDGEANKEVISFLAQILELRKSDVQIISGLKSREKTVRVDGLSIKQIDSLLLVNIEE